MIEGWEQPYAEIHPLTVSPGLKGVCTEQPQCKELLLL